MPKMFLKKTKLKYVIIIIENADAYLRYIHNKQCIWMLTLTWNWFFKYVPSIKYAVENFAKFKVFIYVKCIP